MFKLFQRKHHKKNWQSASELDLYELSEQETDMLMGGSPIRNLISGGNGPSHWQQQRSTHLEGATYQPFPTLQAHNTWQQSQSPWLPQRGYDQTFPRQSYPYR